MPTLGMQSGECSLWDPVLKLNGISKTMSGRGDLASPVMMRMLQTSRNPQEGEGHPLDPRASCRTTWKKAQVTLGPLPRLFRVGRVSTGVTPNHLKVGEEQASLLMIQQQSVGLHLPIRQWLHLRCCLPAFEMSMSHRYLQTRRPRIQDKVPLLICPV